MDGDCVAIHGEDFYKSCFLLFFHCVQKHFFVNVFCHFYSPPLYTGILGCRNLSVFNPNAQQLISYSGSKLWISSSSIRLSSFSENPMIHFTPSWFQFEIHKSKRFIRFFLKTFHFVHYFSFLLPSPAIRPILYLQAPARTEYIRKVNTIWITTNFSYLEKFLALC